MRQDFVHNRCSIYGSFVSFSTIGKVIETQAFGWRTPTASVLVSRILQWGRVWLGQAEILNDRMKCAQKSLTASVCPFCSCRRWLKASHSGSVIFRPPRPRKSSPPGLSPPGPKFFLPGNTQPTPTPQPTGSIGQTLAVYKARGRWCRVD